METGDKFMSLCFILAVSAVILFAGLEIFKGIERENFCKNKGYEHYRGGYCYDYEKGLKQKFNIECDDWAITSIRCVELKEVGQ